MVIFVKEFGEAATMLSATCDEFLKNICDCMDLAESNFGELLFHIIFPWNIYPMLVFVLVLVFVIALLVQTVESSKLVFLQSHTTNSNAVFNGATGLLGGEYYLLIPSKLANQHAWKALFVCLVFANRR